MAKIETIAHRATPNAFWRVRGVKPAVFTVERSRNEKSWEVIFECPSQRSATTVFNALTVPETPSAGVWNWLKEHETNSVAKRRVNPRSISTTEEAVEYLRRASARMSMFDVWFRDRIHTYYFLITPLGGLASPLFDSVVHLARFVMVSRAKQALYGAMRYCFTYSGGKFHLALALSPTPRKNLTFCGNTVEVWVASGFADDNHMCTRCQKAKVLFDK